MTWEKIIKRERTELSELIDEVSDLVMDLTRLAERSDENKATQVHDKIQEKLKKAHDLEMARFWKEHHQSLNRRE